MPYFCTLLPNRMKTLILSTGLLFLHVAVFAQQKDISVFEKKDGDKNIVVARNTGKVPYLVTLDIHASGMIVQPGLKTETVVPAGYMKDLATLTPTPGEAWTYGYDVSYIQYTANTPSPSTSSDVTISKSNEAPGPSPTANAKTATLLNVDLFIILASTFLAR